MSCTHDIDALKSTFEKVFGKGGGIRIFDAPGRVNLIGEHIDYCGGRVFPAALTLSNMVLCRGNGTGKVRMYATDLKITAEFSLDDIDAAKTLKWGNYPAGVAKELAAAGCELQGVDMLFDSTLPFGSGLSSSASVELASGLALLSFSENAEEMMKKLDKYDIISNIKFYDSGIGLLTKDGLTKKRKYIIMEFGSEENLLKKVKKTSNGFSEDSGKYILYEIIDAVKSLHKIGITHRDIKPENMFLVGEGQNLKLKLCDFGLSTFFKDENLVKIYLNEHVGTPAFVAPEIIKQKSYRSKNYNIYN